MKISKVLTVCLIAAIAVACGKKQEMPESLSPETSVIEGNMGEYFEVVEGTYPVSKFTNEFSFDVKRIKADDVEMYTKLGIGYEILDSDGNVLVSENAVLEDLNPLSSYQFLSLKEGEMGKVKVDLRGWPDMLKGAKTFKISINARGEDNVTNVAEDYDDHKGPATNNWDSILDEYESYCNNVVALYKKAMSGDMSAMTDYASALEQAQSLSDKLENAKADLTPAQAARLSKIASKMAGSIM